MKIIMLGAPGAGKGTQAKKIAAKYGIPHISTGDIFRANIKGGTELGMKAKSYMDQGQLVPDDVTIGMLLDRIAEADCENGYVLDGFPRTIPQAESLTEALDKLGQKMDFAIDVDVPDESIINRMSGRRACLSCGATYHIVYNPTRVEGVCDACGQKLVLRDDDNKPLVYEPGLHFKIPFIETVKMLDARIQTMDNQADRFVTKEKKDLIVDSYIKWRISDFSRYYLATGGGDISQAEVLLKRKFSDRLRSEIGRLDVKDIVTDSRGRLTLEVRDALNSGSAGTEDEVTTPAADNAIAEAAERVTAETKGKVPVINPNSMAALGIEVVDVRIKQINLPTEVSEAIYNRMRAEREAVARRHRSQGQEEAEKLRATADYEVTRTLAEAERQGRIMRGEGDAEAAKLFADAFSKDPDFYAFIRSLRAYENSFSGNQDVMVMSPDSDFFRYMKTPTSATR